MQPMLFRFEKWFFLLLLFQFNRIQLVTTVRRQAGDRRDTITSLFHTTTTARRVIFLESRRLWPGNRITRPHSPGPRAHCTTHSAGRTNAVSIRVDAHERLKLAGRGRWSMPRRLLLSLLAASHNYYSKSHGNKNEILLKHFPSKPNNKTIG